MMNWKRALRTTCLAALTGAVAMALPTLSLTPSSNATGAPGQTVGWGFNLSNDVNWIEVSQAQFCLDAVVSNPCFNASPLFTDIISTPPNDVVVGPASSVGQAYNLAGHLGLGNYAIPTNATAGQILGHILLTYNTFDADPNAGGNQIGFNNAISTAVTVTVVTPEPVAAVLAGVGLLGLWCKRRLTH